jgi:hypothetical protein
VNSTDPMVRAFCSHVAAELGVSMAIAMESALSAIDIEGDGNPHATACWEAVRWVLNRKDRLLVEKLAALERLLNNRGTIRLPQDLGWQS